MVVNRRVVVTPSVSIKSDTCSADRRRDPSPKHIHRVPVRSGVSIVAPRRHRHCALSVPIRPFPFERRAGHPRETQIHARIWEAVLVFRLAHRRKPTDPCGCVDQDLAQHARIGHARPKSAQPTGLEPVRALERLQGRLPQFGKTVRLRCRRVTSALSSPLLPPSMGCRSNRSRRSRRQPGFRSRCRVARSSSP
jgi:hypothetical protein